MIDIGTTPCPIFCGQDFLDEQERVSYTVLHEKQVLINFSVQFEKQRREDG